MGMYLARPRRGAHGLRLLAVYLLTVTTALACTAFSWAGIPATWAVTPSLAPGDVRAVPPTDVGDGTRVAFYGGNVYNIHHHTSPSSQIRMFECHDKATGVTCPGWSEDGSYFSPTSGAAIDTGANLYYTGIYPGEYLDTGAGRLYFPAGTTATSGYTNTVGVGCIDLVSNTSCGFVALTTGAASPATASPFPPHADISGAARVGTELYYTTARGKLLCFDTSTQAACPGQPFTVASALNGNTDPGGTLQAMTTESAGDFVYTVHSRRWATPTPTVDLSCFRASTKQLCLGYPKVNQRFAVNGYSRFIAPVLDGAGNPIGACWSGNYQFRYQNGWKCLNNSGNSIATPPWQAPYPEGSSVGFTFGSPLILGTKMYFHSVEVETGTGVTTYTCFDFSTNAPCAGFTPASSGAVMRSYTIAADPSAPNCLWALGDAGRIETFDATTGQMGC